MGAYDFNFDLPPGVMYAPSPDRVRALQALMPPGPFSFAPPVTDRAAWSPWQTHPFSQSILKAARELAAQPYPDLTDAAFLDCLAKEDVTHINVVVQVVRKRQVAFLLAEAIHDTGEFIAVIGDDLRKLAALRTWIHPGNDLKRLNFDLKTVEPDLGVVHYLANLAETDFILGARLPADVRALILEQANLRVFQPLRQRLETGRDVFWCIGVKHNWNAAYLACCAEAATALLPSAADRAYWLAFAESLVRNSRDGYNDDGVCVEGVSYWSYSFTNYIALSESLRMATGGVIDLLDEPKMARASRFADEMELQPGVFPTYADCVLDVQPVTWTRLWPHNRRGTPAHAVEPAAAGTDPFAGMILQFAVEPLLWMFRTNDPRRPQRPVLAPGLRSWFEASSLLVCRPSPATKRKLSASLLGGHNGVNHNHNDLGTFTVVLDGRTLVLDPGMEIYSFRTFSIHRYDSPLLNSYGHPVPKVAGRLQEAGPEWRTKLLAKEFTDDTDRVVFDLKPAYDVPALRRLEREFIFDRRGDGSVTVIDRVEFATPSAFESALITLGQIDVQGSKIRLSDGPAVLMAEVSIDGAPLEISTETIDQPPNPKRIALRCGGEVLKATVKAVLRPA